jgi:hypothetical protein
MKTYFRLGLIASGLLVILGSCRKEPLNNLSTSDTRIYITQFDSTATFSSYSTFSVSDSVAVLQNGQSVGMERTAADSLFIQAFTSAMQTAGYTLVTKEQSPNLGINLTHVINSYIGVTYFSDYGSYWNPYYWGYYGYGYGFPYYYVAYQVNVEGMAFDMFDLKNATANKQLKDIWSALIQGQGIFNTANIPTEVGYLFSQSTYLKQ